MVDTSPTSHSATPPITTDSVPPTPQVNVEALAEQLLGRWKEDRLAARKTAAKPELHQINGLSMQEHRERVMAQLRVLVEEGAIQRAFPTSLGGSDNHGGNIASFEELVTADPSLQIKSGVQWGLFGAAILHLGTAPHHERWLPQVINLEMPGAFAMTETGHGSDVANIATTATYDESTEEFVIDTPFRGAWKDYIGNAAIQGIACVLFAQLITKGVNHGVHAFFVPIRDTKGNFLPGVGGDDDGLKGGLNGIDNGRLHFTDVRIPRTNLLNRYGDVAPDGTYSSPIDSPGRRFFTMIGTLVQGRVSLDGAAAAAMKLGLHIALTYGSQRRQFTVTEGGEERVILDYQRHQRRLIPKLAETFAVTFAHERLLRKFDEVFSGADDSDANREELETLAAVLKSLSTWAALDTLQECREACGGAGFLAENRLTGLRADLDIYVTFEGDNNVLLQLVAKRLLSDYSSKFRNADFGVMARYVAERAGDTVLHGTGLRRLAQNVSDFGSTARAVGQVRDVDYQRALLGTRVGSMVATVAERLKEASKLPPEEGARLFNENQNELIEAARAYGEFVQWETFTRAVNQTMDAGNRQILTWLRDLFGLSLIEKHVAWYLINGRLSGQRAESVTQYIDRLVERIRPYALDLIETFGYGPEHVRAPIALGAEKQRQDEARAYYAAQRAAGIAPVHEKTLKKRQSR
ncbi:acyl-CoA dehydrogenase [Lysinibacter sp. HNR]|uniref:acyl-CoA dehydrogenase family protein n=1 Tax=Lysinibacter sp. HNR TaxID=3031408 RepID=UPI00243549FB|nr:acyl-CoA dehydrogenase [Lysinibacter sp. HNR]WGD37836.1 acyl-CoA dehydrogenase [Lysinibacter sp. HNR]